MKLQSKLFRGLLAAGILVSAPLAVSASNTTATLQVSATVAPSCSFSSSSYSLAFGTIDPSVLQAGTSSLSITCSSGASYTIDLSAGNNGSGSSAAPTRAMVGSNSGALLYYVIALPADLATPPSSSWGDAGASGTVGVNYTASGSGIPQAVSIRAVTGGGQNVPPDSYSDQVTITAWF